MTIKNMFMLTGLLAGAAYLRDKGRRDRLATKARGLLDRATTRASDLADKVESKASDALASAKKDNGVATRSSAYESYETSGYSGGTRNYR